LVLATDKVTQWCDACFTAIKLGKLKDEIDEISVDGTTQRLAELDQRRLIKLHEKVADAAVSIECYHLALHHYHCMVVYDFTRILFISYPAVA